MYLRVCVCVCVCIYIYIYIYRERERERGCQIRDSMVFLYIYIYIYIYISTHTHRYIQTNTYAQEAKSGDPSGKLVRKMIRGVVSACLPQFDQPGHRCKVYVMAKLRDRSGRYTRIATYTYAYICVSDEIYRNKMNLVCRCIVKHTLYVRASTTFAQTCIDLFRISEHIFFHTSATFAGTHKFICIHA